jgi:AcrR family transcriptional regulator
MTPVAQRRPARKGRVRVAQEERSERSRAQILDAALQLFSRQGYRGTSIREIALAAKLSTGNVYHQFPDKESLFRVLLERYFEILASADHPLIRALAMGAFPADLEALARATREGVERDRAYVALIYVDVVEFEGQHIRRYYTEMADRFTRFLEDHRDRIRLDMLRPGVPPTTAVMLASRFFLHYFAVEHVFRVPNHFGKDTDTVLRETVEILAHGMLRPPGPAEPA